MPALYTLQVEFHGLCAAVTEGHVSTGPKKAHVLLPDPKRIKMDDDCKGEHAHSGHGATLPAHRPVLVFHAEDFDSESPPSPHSLHSVVTDNTGTLWGILPLDNLQVMLPSQSGDLEFDKSCEDLPDLEAIAKAGKIRSSCIHKPESEPISSLVHFAAGGTLFARNKTTEVWSFGTPGPCCYLGKQYAMNATFLMHSPSGAFKINYRNFVTQEAGYLVLVPKSEFSRVRVSISNHPALEKDDGTGTHHQHSVVFFKLSEAIVQNPPMPKPTPDCTEGAGGGGGGGIGCTPFLMYV